MAVILDAKQLCKAFGAVRAANEVSAAIEKDSVVGLIGTNGAGKTTTLRTLSGLLKPSAGKIMFDGKPLTGVAAHKIVALGLAHSPEGRHIFPRLTIEENLQLGAFLRKDKEAIEKFGSSDSGASLGDILGAALREKAKKD